LKRLGSTETGIEGRMSQIFPFPLDKK